MHIALREISPSSLLYNGRVITDANNVNKLNRCPVFIITIHFYCYQQIILSQTS